MKKASGTGADFQFSLLDWRNTPTEGMGSSPAQRMFGRRTRTLLPTARQLLKPELVKDVRHKKYQRQEKQTHYYNQNTKELPGLKEGETVRMKPMSGDSKHRWIKAQVEDQVDVRSYAVRTEDGRRFRRNRRHLRQSRETFGSKDADMTVPGHDMAYHSPVPDKLPIPSEPSQGDTPTPVNTQDNTEHPGTPGWPRPQPSDHKGP